MLADDCGMAGAMQVDMAACPRVLCSREGENYAQGFRYVEIDLPEFQ
jgi:hypothetical protein